MFNGNVPMAYVCVWMLVSPHFFFCFSKEHNVMRNQSSPTQRISKFKEPKRLSPTTENMSLSRNIHENGVLSLSLELQVFTIL